MGAGVILTDGSYVAIQDMSNDCTSFTGDVCGNVYVDVNGYKPPNKFGKDIYMFYIKQKGLFPLAVNDCDPSNPAHEGRTCTYSEF